MYIRIRRGEFVHHEAEMFAFNALDDFVPFTIVHKSEVHELCYKLDGLVSFDRFIEGEGCLRYGLFMHLLESIARCHKVCQEYLLRFEHISFDLKDIYMTDDGFRYLLVPMEKKEHNFESLERFMDTLALSFDPGDKEAAEKYHQIQLAFKKEHFSMAWFIEHIVSRCLG